MNERERSVAIEQLTSAWRPQNQDGGIRPHPVWNDLDPAARDEAARITLGLRAMEAALDPEGLSTTARGVLARIRGQS